MKISYDKESDAVYLILNETAVVKESEEVRPGVILDFDEKNQVVGVEILSASRHVSIDELKRVLVDVA
jgi:uncharacterized protein YuzE